MSIFFKGVAFNSKYEPHELVKNDLNDDVSILNQVAK